VRNASQQESWYLNQWGALSHSVAVYAFQQASEQRLQQLKPLRHARNITHYLPLAPGSEHTLYLRVQNQHVPLTLSLILLDGSAQLMQVMDTYPLISVVAGGLVVLALYNFLYFLYLRDRGFLILAMTILAITLELGNHTGMLQAFFWSSYLSGIGSPFGFIATAGGMQLLRHWLNTPVNQPRLDSWWLWFIRIALGLAVVAPLLAYGVAVTGIWILCLTAFAVVSLVLFYRQGLSVPPSLVLAGLIFMVSLTPALLRSLYLVDAHYGLAEFPLAALLLALILLSHAQAEQMRQRNKQAERIQAENKAKDEFLTTMSHELRTPMTAVTGAGQLLRLTALSDIQKEYVTRLNISSEHMLALINDILDLARLDSQPLQLEQVPFRLNTVLQQVQQLLQPQAAGKQLPLLFDNQFLPLKQYLVGDPVRLKQILLNLLSNAIKFTHQGQVRLSIMPQPVATDRIRLFIEVRDSGIGLSAAEQQKLFRPFSQADSSTSRQYGGSGLGLAISHKLVENMGGELQVESKPGQGSRFFFAVEFRLQDGDLPEAEQQLAVSAPASVAFNGFHVLLVDDEEINRFFGEKLLVSLGAEVTVADGSEMALHCLKQQTFDLVLMDISMPGRDGYETTRYIRRFSQWQHLPVIALTAHAISGERQRCLAAGMNDYLSKPVERDVLQKVLSRWLGGRSRVCS
jgi:signal transduction histidine kinase/CheY-like chemotaxis protein